MSTAPDTSNSPDVLLESFTQEDFETARANLLQRYRLWNGLLISNDEHNIITPDDLNAFRLQASEISEQEVKSEYELEQLKILTVLIYLLMNADNVLSGELAAGVELEENCTYPFRGYYIPRLILQQCPQLSSTDIEKLVSWQNHLIAEQTADDNDQSGILAQQLFTHDNKNLILKFSGHELSLETSASPLQTPLEQTSAQPPEPVITEGTVPTTKVMLGESTRCLQDNIYSIQLACGPKVAAATYIGIGREENEDGILLCPVYNQLTVIDAMGGYGNGIKARNLFIEDMIQSPGDIEANILSTQSRYDASGLEHGGVCLIHFEVIKHAEDYHITLSQAGDVHAVLFDDSGKLCFETKDEAIGHRVFNAIISHTATRFQRANGWESFGKLTKSKIKAQTGWRMAIYSDGIANHFPSSTLQQILLSADGESVIGKLSANVDTAMRRPGAYQDNCSITIIDF